MPINTTTTTARPVQRPGSNGSDTNGAGTHSTVENGSAPPSDGKGAASENATAGRHALPKGEVFTFTVSDGQVTGAGIQLPSGDAVQLSSNADVTFSLDGADILSQRSTDHGLQIARFSDTDADGLFEMVATARVNTDAPSAEHPRPTLNVTLNADGSAPTDIVRTLRDGTEKVLLSSTVTNEHVSWSVQDGLLVQTITTDSGQTHWGAYRDGNDDGVYTLVADGRGDMIAVTGILSATDSVADLL